MKKKSFTILLALMSTIILTACSQNDSQSTTESNNAVADQVTVSSQENEIANTTISVENGEFRILMDDTQTGRELVGRLPATSMRLPLSYDQDGNRKIYDMPTGVTTDPVHLDSAEAGDLFLEGADRLVLFYQNTPIDGDYTIVGRVEDPTELAELLGNEDIVFTVTKEEQ